MMLGEKSHPRHDGAVAPSAALLYLGPSNFKPRLKVHSLIYLPLSLSTFTITQVPVAAVHKPSFSPLGTLLQGEPVVAMRACEP